MESIDQTMVATDQQKLRLFNPHRLTIARSPRPPETRFTGTTIHVWAGPVPDNGHTIDLISAKTSTHVSTRDSTHLTWMVSYGVHLEVLSHENYFSTKKTLKKEEKIIFETLGLAVKLSLVTFFL